MPGLSTGLSPAIIATNTDLSADTLIEMCKFPIVHTVTDTFAIAQNALTGNTTDFATIKLINGKTTGNQTTATSITIGGASVSWVAYTGKTSSRNYTFSANHWMVTRNSEDGTVAFGTFTTCVWAVAGNV